jgi:hypothetical protein
MYQKYSLNSNKWHILKQEHHTMQVPKYGETNLIMQSPIFGLLGVFSMKCVLFIHLFKAKTYKVFTSALKKESIKQSLTHTQKNYQIL